MPKIGHQLPFLFCTRKYLLQNPFLLLCVYIIHLLPGLGGQKVFSPSGRPSYCAERRHSRKKEKKF